ncbi:MAG: FAD-dependent oxidoreductase [Qingshengfaniella sp.]
MKSSYQAVVIGGGVVGASVLYHLAKLGWTDVALVERSELTAGSTWHAAAGFHALNGDPNIASLQDYTINLYREIEEESGQSCGLHMTGGINLATTGPRWEQLKAGWATFRAIGVETAQLLTPAEIEDRTKGVIKTSDVLGGLYDSNEGYLDPNGTTYAYANAARKRGADLILRNRVLDLNQRADGTWDVTTENGTIHTEHVVNCGGLWAKQLGHMAGVDLPVTPMEHHYLITEKFDPLDQLDGELPIIVDPEGYTYTRQEHDGLLLGVYERDARHWYMDGAPWDYGMDLIPEDIDRIGEELSLGFERFPGLETVGIKRWVNGAFTFAPDGNPLVGPIGPRGYWVACGVMAGFSQGGGVGKALAEWMIHGQPEQDIFGMDVARYGAHQSNKEYIRQTTAQFYARRFVLTYPNEQLPAGRTLRTTSSYAEMDAAGARWGDSWGLETPLYFAPEGFEEPGTMQRSTAFPLVAEECKACETTAGMLDIAGFARYRITGKDATKWLDRLIASKIPATGRVRLAVMLGHDGRLKGDMTCFNWGDGSFWLMGSYYLRAFHMRWFQQNLAGDVRIEDISDDVTGFSLNGPKTFEILSKISETDLSDLRMMHCRDVDLGLHRARIARLSLSGETAVEISVPASEHAQLRRLLLKAGTDLGLKEIGFRAMFSMRLEKGIGIWNAEFTQAYTPAMTGLDRWIDTTKPDFIGKAAAAADNAPTRRLVTLEIDATDADAVGFEPIWQNSRIIGMTTSGAYGHRVSKSLAMALVDTNVAEEGQSVIVHVIGEERQARIIPATAYDPTGAKMRG